MTPFSSFQPDRSWPPAQMANWSPPCAYWAPPDVVSAVRYGTCTLPGAAFTCAGTVSDTFRGPLDPV